MGQLVLNGDEWTNTALAIAMELGSTIGAIGCAHLSKRVPYERILVVALFAIVPVAVVYAGSPNVALALIAMAVFGAVDTASLGDGSSAYLQHRVMPSRLGSAIALNMAGWNLCFGIGSGISGLLADAFGVRQTLIALAIMFLVCAVAAQLIRLGFWKTIAAKEGLPS